MPRLTSFFLTLILSLMAALGARAQQATPDISVTFYYAERFSGASVDLPDVALGARAREYVYVKNTGTATLTLSSFSVDGPNANEVSVDLSLGTHLYTIAPGSTRSFMVKFKPGALGLRTATLHLVTDDPDESPFHLQMNCVGVAPIFVTKAEDESTVANGRTLDFGALRVLYAQAAKYFEMTHTGPVQATGLQFHLLSPQPSYHPFDEDFTYEGYSPYFINPGEGTLFGFNFWPRYRGQRTQEFYMRGVVGGRVTILQDLILTGWGLQPIARVEQPVGKALVFTGSASTMDYTRDFGTVGLGGEATLTYTLKNLGDAPMPTTSDFGGSHTGDFTLMTLPKDPLLPGESTTMTVRFKPQGLGARTAYLRVWANALFDERPVSQVPQWFTLVFRGNAAPSVITLSAPVFRAAHGSSHALVTLTRSPGDAPATVQLDASDVTASGVPPAGLAQAGLDYTALADPANVVNFAIGETEKTVAIPLLSPAGRNATHRRFKVTLSNPGSDAVLGSQTSAAVYLMAEDKTKPTLTLTAPAAGNVASALPLLISGKAGDAMGLERVEVKLNNAAPVLAELGATTSNTAVPFTLSITPLAGLNVLVVTAYDLRGNSTVVTRSFTLFRRRRLTLETRDLEAEGTPSFGKLALTAAPASRATALTPAGAVWPKTSDIQVGTPVTLVVQPIQGYVFDGSWTLSLGFGSSLTLLGDTATFIMPDADITMRAGFVSSPFAPLPGQKNGHFFWMLRPGEAAPASVATHGLLNATLTSTGSLSGKLFINGQSLPVTAVVYGEGPATFTVAGKKRAALPVPGGELRLDHVQPEGELRATLTLTGGGASSAIGKKALYSTVSKTPDSLLNTATKGYYTLRLSPQVPAPSQGFGYATMNLTNAGALSLTGVLADGATLTASTVLVEGNAAPVFVQLPTPGAATKLSLVTGMVAFDPTQVDSDAAGDLLWFRPAANPKVLLYTAGWPGGIHLQTVATLYNEADVAHVSLGLGPVAAGPGNTRLAFTGGKLAGPIEKTNLNIYGNDITKLLPADPSYTLTLAPKTGFFSGMFTPNWSQPATAKPAYKGVILQKGASRGGYGFFMNNAKGETAPESGAVSLGRP